MKNSYGDDRKILNFVPVMNTKYANKVKFYKKKLLLKQYFSGIEI